MNDDADIRALSETLVAALIAEKNTLATAESCTGGWIAKAITDVAGSSAVFGYGVVSYSNDAKTAMLGVPGTVLTDHGAVSETTVRAMAEGVVSVSGADFGLAVSGIAGPDGGTADKPVGTVWFAWTTCEHGRTQTDADVQRFAGDRDAVRRATVLHALRGIKSRLRG